jgi:hypothetical protein
MFFSIVDRPQFDLVLRASMQARRATITLGPSKVSSSRIT